MKKIKLDKYLILLLVLSVVLLASSVRYGLRTYKVPEWDEQHYMRMSTEFYRMIKYDLSFETPYEMLQVVPFRQPGYPILVLPFLFVFGLSKAYLWGIVTNGVLYALSIFGIYFLAKNFISKLASFLAAFIFALYGWTLLHLNLTYSETASSAFTILTILFLVKSDLFRNRKYSILFGLFLGLGLLVRWTILVYLFGALIFVVYKIVKKHLLKKKILLNIALAFLIALIISFYPYFQNYYWIFHYFYDVRPQGPIWQIFPEEERNPFSVYSLTFYLNSFAQLGIFFFVLIIIGLILAFKRKSKTKLVLLTVIAGYLFSSFALIKGERYIVPIYPYLAIISASVFDHIRNKKIKTLLIIFTLVLSTFSFLGSTWGKGPMRESLASLPFDLPFGQWKKIYLTTYSRPPYIYKISGKEILDFIEKDSRESKIKKNPQILSLFYYRPLDEPLMTYNLYNMEKPFQINNFVGTVIEDPEKGSEYIIGVVEDSDYILLKSGKRVDRYFSKENYKTLEALVELFEGYDFSATHEEKTKIWINQDSSEVTILKKKRDFTKEEKILLQTKLAEILKSN